MKTLNKAYVGNVRPDWNMAWGNAAKSNLDGLAGFAQILK